MTQVYLHAEIEDHFMEFDYREVVKTAPDGGENDLRRKIMEAYVGEKIVLLRGVRLDYDRAFINAIEFPHTWSFKKFASRVIEAKTPLAEDPAKQEVCAQLFGGDEGRYRHFEAEVRRVNTSIRAALNDILRHHQVSKKDIVWRHTETRVENLHFDIDKDAGDFESVRIYYNMDDVPRIWHTTHSLTHLMNYYYDALNLRETQSAPLERLLHLLSVRLFGNWASRGREQFPRHMALFEPDDVWLVDGRTVPHQVIYGRRVASTFYRLEREGLPPWHPMLADKVAAIHQAHAAGAPIPAMPYDMRGYVYPFEGEGPRPAPSVTPPKNLKAEWSTLYEDSMQHKLVRL